jgi:uncharacterized protein (TIGR00730 family)
VKRVLVFCGSSPGRRPEYTERAFEIGGTLAERGIEVVYGGASVGVMGALADGALAAGGAVIGVIPRRLLESEIAHAGLTKLHITETMHERKALMSELSDAVMALPGGSGTLDELFEVFTWRQLGLHKKPIGLLDVAGYWQPLVAFLDHAVDERFLRVEHLETLLVDTDAVALLDRLATHEPRVLDKWLDRRDGSARARRDDADQTVPNTRSPASPKPGRM